MKIVFAFAIVLVGLAACAVPPLQPTLPTGGSEGLLPTEPAQTNLPNPASVYCEQQGYTVEIRTAADGSQSGVCIFPDGSECDEWAYYRGECQPGATQTTPAGVIPSPELDTTPDPLPDAASDGCKIYRNPDFGYSFHYPADAEIIHNDDPLGGITVVGPVQDGEAWPMLGMAHPRDREEYRPPEDADLLRWLTDQSLLGETRVPDVQIAGTTAIHLHHERSPQSYASERYFFAREGQLYMVLILHAGDREDWDLYNHFLESIQFEGDSQSGWVQYTGER